MATEMDRAYYEWPQVNELLDQNDCQEPSISQLLDHGSVSFGRFAVESLSWEKWSVFSHNRWKEELDKFRAAGLVAQKKAYFEEYYRKVRALKALQFQQDGQPMDSGDSGVCSQGPEDEQSTARADNCIDGQDVDVVREEEDIAKVPVDQEMLIVDIPQVQHLNPLPISCTSYHRSSKEGKMEELKNPNLHEEEVTIDFINERAPEAVQLEKYEHLDGERIKIEDTVQYGSSVEDKMHRKSGIKQANIPGPARLEVNHKINENLASVTKKKAIDLGRSIESLKQNITRKKVVDLGRSIESLKQNVTRKESSTVRVRNSAGADLKKGNLSKSLVGLNNLHKIPGNEESRIKLAKTVNNGKKAIPSSSHKLLRENSSGTSVERNAKIQTRKSLDVTKSPLELRHPFPLASSKTKDAMSPRIEVSSGQSTTQKLKNPVPETRKTKNVINTCTRTSNAHSATNKSRKSGGISSFPSSRSSRESSSVSLWGPSKEILSSGTFPRTLPISGERQACNRDCAQSGSHSSFSNRPPRSSVDAKSLSTKEISAGKALICGIRDTAPVNRRCANSSQRKAGGHQHGRNDRENKQEQEKRAVRLKEPHNRSKPAPSPKQNH